MSCRLGMGHITGRNITDVYVGRTIELNDLKEIYLYGKGELVLEAVEVMFVAEERYEEAHEVLQMKELFKESNYKNMSVTMIDGELSWNLSDNYEQFIEACQYEKGHDKKYLVDMNKMKPNK